MAENLPFFFRTAVIYLQKIRKDEAANEANYDWLLSFTTNRDKTLVEQYSGAYYG